jgi:hypothetical protein
MPIASYYEKLVLTFIICYKRFPLLEANNNSGKKGPCEYT